MRTSHETGVPRYRVRSKQTRLSRVGEGGEGEVGVKELPSVSPCRVAYVIHQHSTFCCVKSCIDPLYFL